MKKKSSNQKKGPQRKRITRRGGKPRKGTQLKAHIAGALSFQKVKELVNANNNSQLSTELVIAVCWKESSFNPSVTATGSTATGLLMLTKGAVADVNSNTPPGTHFEHSEMKNATKNVQCGTWYLNILMRRLGNDKKKALEQYGTGAGYADDLLRCETCMLSSVVVDPVSCLKQIHP
jgi:soluble lytic murein transglycosylase-like protein